MRAESFGSGGQYDRRPHHPSSRDDGPFRRRESRSSRDDVVDDDRLEPSQWSTRLNKPRTIGKPRLAIKRLLHRTGRPHLEHSLRSKTARSKKHRHRIEASSNPGSATGWKSNEHGSTTRWLHLERSSDRRRECDSERAGNVGSSPLFERQDAEAHDPLIPKCSKHRRAAGEPCGGHPGAIGAHTVSAQGPPRLAASGAFDGRDETEGVEEGGCEVHTTIVVAGDRARRRK